MRRILGTPALIAVAAILAGILLIDQEPASVEAHHLCPNTGSPFGPFDFQTYEASDYKNVYARTMELAGFNQLFPDVASFAMPRLEVGDRGAGSGSLGDTYIPPVLLKSIGWIESGWAQADYSVPYGAVGPVLASHDCGYGIMQVTSGMQNVSGVPNMDQAMIGGHFGFNIARGARILADKWNHAPEYRPIVGNRDPHVIENWYYALWAYNGFSFRNHPFNPAFDPQRPPYRCDGTQPRSAYPYQELVLGCAANPPWKSGGYLWNAQAAVLPDLSNPAFAGPLNLNNWAPCSQSLQCAPMDMPPASANQDPTGIAVTRSQIMGAPVMSIGQDLFSIVTVPPVLEGTALLTIGNAGTGVLAWRARSSAGWLKISQYEGVALGSDLGSVASVILLSIDTGGLVPGRYTSEIQIESLWGGIAAPRTVSVTLENYPEGTLLRGAGPAVYLMGAGVKRHVPNPTTFDALGLNWQGILSIPDAVLSSLPTGQPLLDTMADGNLFQGSGLEVFVMQGGARRHVIGPPVMANCGYGWDAVRPVSDSVLSGIPIGNALSGSPCPRFSPPEDALLAGTGPAVFLVKRGLARLVPNPLSFEAHGLLWGNLNRVPDSQIASLPPGHPLLNATADGNLLRGSGPAVWVMQGGVKQHVIGPTLMSDCGYGWDAVRTVSDVALNAIPTSDPLSAGPCPRLTPPDGTLITGSGPAVYVMQNMTRRHIAGPGVLQACGYEWGNVDTLPDSALAAIPSGPQLSGPPCP